MWDAGGAPLKQSVRITMSNEVEHERYIRRCIELAQQAILTNDTPVGSLIVRGDQVIAESAEAVRGRGDVTAHAEIQALRAAFARLDSLDLTGCTLYTSVEPCVMCAYAIRLARVSAVVSGARPPDVSSTVSGHKVLSDGSILSSHPLPLLVRDVLAAECRAVLAKR
jgi:tRNA(adenine34) deaminase